MSGMSGLRPPRQGWERWSPFLWGLVLLALYWWTFSGLDAKAGNVLQRLPQAGRIFNLMVHPNWKHWNLSWTGMLESLQMAILATTLAALLALPFGFLAARNLYRWRGMSEIGKFLLNAIRNFPEILLGLLFTKGFGPGAMAGIMAVGIHSIGMLGKLYAEVIEQVDRQVVEAVESTGAGRLQVLFFAVIPQVLPDLASYALYRFEINVRAATVLGVVGAGGIGTPLLFSVQQGAWDTTGLIIGLIIVVVSLIDYGSAWLRRRLV